MIKRKQRSSYRYGKVLSNSTQLFRLDLYSRIKLEKLFRDKKILDVGCGYGIDSYNLLRYARTVIGTDIKKHASWYSFTNRRLKFRQSKSEKLPFRRNSFDGVFLKDLLHHVDDPTTTLGEIRRVTRKGGVIIVIEGNRYNPLFLLYATVLNGHNHFSQKEFKKLIDTHFPKTRFEHLECYPPFFLNENSFRYVLKIEKMLEKISFLKPFFSYNIAIVRNL